MSDLTPEEREERRLERKAERRRARRREIVEEARALIDEGEIDFAVQDLADRLGVSQPSIFYYFSGGKDELLADVAWADFSANEAETSAACEACETGVDALEMLIRKRFEQYERDWRRIAFVLDIILKIPLVETSKEQEFYATVNSLFDIIERKLNADIERGYVRSDVDARLRAHSANMQTLGLIRADIIRRRSGGTSLHTTRQFMEDFCRQVRLATLAFPDASD